jgi:hypothetical protein
MKRKHRLTERRNRARDWRRFNDGQFLLPSVLQRKLPSTFRDSRTCDSEPAILRSTFLADTTADTSGKRTRLSRNALSASLSCFPLLLLLAEDGIGNNAIARHPQPALFISASAAIADPLLRRAFGRRVRSRTLTVLHEYASGPHGSARRSRDAAQRFRNEPSWIMRASQNRQRSHTSHAASGLTRLQWAY